MLCPYGCSSGRYNGIAHRNRYHMTVNTQTDINAQRGETGFLRQFWVFHRDLVKKPGFWG